MYNKYLKYKKKYINLRNLIGGSEASAKEYFVNRFFVSPELSSKAYKADTKNRNFGIFREFIENDIKRNQIKNDLVGRWTYDHICLSKKHT